MAKKSDFNTSRSVKDLQAEYGKMPPQAVDLEEAVLGALMLERDAFSIVGDLLEPDAFYKDAHQKIFRAIHKLFLNDDPVDLLTVSEALKQSGELEQVGGYYYLSQLTTTFVRHRRSVSSSPARKNKIFCFSEQEKNR